jgi:hypothetical protein
VAVDATDHAEPVSPVAGSGPPPWLCLMGILRRRAGRAHRQQRYPPPDADGLENRRSPLAHRLRGPFWRAGKNGGGTAAENLAGQADEDVAGEARGWDGGSGVVKSTGSDDRLSQLNKTNSLFSKVDPEFQFSLFAVWQICRHYFCMLACSVVFAFFHVYQPAFAQSDPVRAFAVGGAIYSFGKWEHTENWDHTIVRLGYGEKDEKYFVLFTNFLAMSRALEKTTSWRITTQIYEVVDGGFSTVRDEKVANAVLELGEIVLEQSLTDNPPTFQGSKGKPCDFLTRRFWRVETKNASDSDWYFVRLSSRPMDSGVYSTRGCENLDGEHGGTSQVTTRGPWVYNIGQKTILVDPSFPIAILATPKLKAARLLHLFDNRQLPQIFAREIKSSGSVLRFHFEFRNSFDDVWSQLTTGRSCTHYNSDELNLTEFLDSERKYIRE